MFSSSEPSSPERDEPHSFVYKKLEWEDFPDYDIGPQLDEAANFIHESLKRNENILVHCYMGKSRSTSACIAYLIKYQNHTVDSALEMIKAQRPQVCPNEGFIKELQQFYNEFQ